MLNKRTNLLLEKKDYSLLQIIAEKEGASVGELIRRAISKTYKQKAKSEAKAREKIVAEIFALRQKTKAKKINYKALIEYGRKY